MSSSCPTISVIIPVYNIETYITQCVSSIIEQTYRHLEIILVDDGSTDSSPLICDNFKTVDKRVFVVHKRNGGLSSARNAGIDASHGDYISFIDGDDYINKFFYERIMLSVKKTVKKECVVAACSMNRFFDRETPCVNELEYKTVEMSVEEAFLDISNSALGHKSFLCNVSACQFVFPRRMVDRIRFIDGKHNEDWFFSYRLLEKASSVVFVNGSLYFYRIRPQSITSTQRIPCDLLEGMQEMLTFLNDNNYHNAFNKLEAAFLKRSINALTIYSRVNNKNIDNNWRTIVSGIKKHNCKKSIHFLDLKSRLKVHFVSLFPNLYFLILKKRSR